VADLPVAVPGPSASSLPSACKECASTVEAHSGGHGQSGRDLPRRPRLSPRPRAPLQEIAAPAPDGVGAETRDGLRWNVSPGPRPRPV